MAKEKRQPLTTESEIIKRKSRQLDQLEQESDQEHPLREGPHTLGFEDADDPDHYGPQDQFGDVDGQDPYSNLDEQDAEVPADDLDDLDQSLYGLAEPLARPGDVSRQGSDKDRQGTRRSQDQQGYQQ